MRTASFCCVTVLAILPAIGVSQNAKLPVQKAIEAQFPVTKPTADHKDMVTAGAVIDLQKDNLLMNGVDQGVAANVTYKDGKFEASGINKFQNLGSRFGKPAAGSRTFVAGEKFWLIGVDVRDDATVLEFLSDPISDVRYKVFVKYPYAKGAIPTPDAMVKVIGETIKAEPMDAKGGDSNAQQAPAALAAPAPPPPPMADIPPPPPPADAAAAPPKTISLGQTKDQVAAIFGQPTKVVNLGTKEVDYYPDMKVTFVKGKVTDVQ
jgi:hypothetical protein